VEVSAERGSLVDFILCRPEPVVFADVSQDNRFHPIPLLLEQGVVSGMGVSIHNHKHPYGMLGAYTTQPRQFTPNEGFFLHTIAHVLTMALHRRHIEEERRREQLQRAERLASIGTLAAGIAHEMNNPLNTVMLSADHALSLLPPENLQIQDEIASALRDILQETERCSKIIRNILRFTRHETPHKDRQNLNDVVQRFVQLGPQYLSRPSLPLTYVPGDNLPPVMLNATEIEHVLANLVENALNTADDVHVTLCTEFDGVYVRLLVQDNGPGIRQEDIPYIFDPFYSTRRQRGGIGLGLSIVHAIVADHQGVIHVVSKPGQDTTFVLMFPPAGVEFAST
jgi:signal transduction histidine kinase